MWAHLSNDRDGKYSVHTIAVRGFGCCATQQYNFMKPSNAEYPIYDCIWMDPQKQKNKKFRSIIMYIIKA